MTRRYRKPDAADRILADPVLYYRHLADDARERGDLQQAAEWDRHVAAATEPAAR